MIVRCTATVALVGALAISLTSAPAYAQTPASFEVHEASIVDLEQALASGRTTAVALVDAYLAPTGRRSTASERSAVHGDRCTGFPCS
jgi:hypothetical protein